MNTADFFEILKQHELEAFYGVPDSLLKNFCAYVTDKVDSAHHIITANEGNAIAMACGYYLAKARPAVVYMQNSGLGNCVNPLLSLADDEVYNIPLLMMIGMRGEPGVKDEPQHVKQGKVTGALLDSMGIKHSPMPHDIHEAQTLIEEATQYMSETKKPYAILVSKDSFDSYKLQTKRPACSDLARESAIGAVVEHLQASDVVVATTGHISRELYELRESNKQSHQSDFLSVGSMGHASSIALALAIEKPQNRVFCFDGDGACLMHMGALSIIASQQLTHFKHIIFNNQAHDSVGGQATNTQNTRFKDVALSCGYTKAWSVDSLEQLQNTLPDFLQAQGCVFLEIKVKCGARTDLGRPKEKPVENKESFMNFLNTR